MNHTPLRLEQSSSGPNIPSILQLPSASLQMGGPNASSTSSLEMSNAASMQPLLAYHFQQQQQLAGTMLQSHHYQQPPTMQQNSLASMDLLTRASVSSSTYPDSLQYPLQQQQFQQYLSSYVTPTHRASASMMTQPDPATFSFPPQRSAPSNAAVSTSLYIKNLPLDADKLFLYEKFSPYGAILSVKVLINEESGKCRGVGFVNFSERASAVRAVHNLNGLVVGHSALHVSLQEQQLIPSAYMPWLAGSS